MHRGDGAGAKFVGGLNVSMSAMDQFGERGGVAVPTRSVRRRARGCAAIHLPTWSRLNVAAKQSAPAGNGGDFFEVIQQRDGRVAVVVADVCGNGPSAAAPVEQPALDPPAGDRARRGAGRVLAR